MFIKEIASGGLLRNDDELTLKQMRQLFFTVFVIVTIVSCKEKTETIITEVPALSASSIYKADSVFSYIEKFGDKNAGIAASYLAQAEQGGELRLEKTIYCVKRAITLDPKLEHYKMLGKLLERSQNYDEMFRLYDFLTSMVYIKDKPDVHYIFGTPDENLLHEELVSEYLAKKQISSYSIYKAIDIQGFEMEHFKKSLQNEPRINIDTASFEWKNLMLQFLTPEQAKEYVKSQNIFSYLDKSILDSSNVFTIDEHKVGEFDYNAQNEYEYGDYMGEPGLASFYSNFLVEKVENPNGWYTFDFVHKIKLNNDISALVYAIDSSGTACPKNMRHVYYRLVTYNNLGEMVDNKVVATQSGEKLSTLKFVENRFVITNSKRNWKKQYNKRDYDNYVVNTELIGEESYEINSDGHIAKTSRDM